MAINLTPSQVIDRICKTLWTLPVNLAGSTVAAETYGKPLGAHADVDLFTNKHALFATVQKLLDAGYHLDDRNKKVWSRWLRYGFRKWHTNSIKLEAPFGVDINVIFKTVGGTEIVTMSQVLESFDFGLLAIGYDLQLGIKRDLRPYLFPGYDLNGPLPLMPDKQVAVEQGLFSQYDGLRRPGRYAKYYQYGYDMSLVKTSLITGLRTNALYQANKEDADSILLSQIYFSLADKIENDEVDELMETSKQIVYLDSLDQIMQVLE